MQRSPSSTTAHLPGLLEAVMISTVPSHLDFPRRFWLLEVWSRLGMRQTIDSKRRPGLFQAAFHSRHNAVCVHREKRRWRQPQLLGAWNTPEVKSLEVKSLIPFSTGSRPSPANVDPAIPTAGCWIPRMALDSTSPSYTNEIPTSQICTPGTIFSFFFCLRIKVYLLNSVMLAINV